MIQVRQEMWAIESFAECLQRTMTLPTINAVWIGKRLGPVHAACLASFAQVGHRTILHAFDEIEDLPQGVDIFDAAQLMTTDEISRYKYITADSSPALASDIYRLRILRENLGIYVDCDVYCLKPFPEIDYLFGWESVNFIANGVLEMPPGSELLRCMLNDAENPKFVPSWCGRRKKLELRLRKILGTGDTRPYLPWGSLGPWLLTHHVRRLGLQDVAMDIDIFYSSHYEQVPLLNRVGLTIEDHTTRRSLALHLSSSSTPIGKIQPGSTLDQVVGSNTGGGVNPTLGS